jgi:hypothetical protein
MKRDILLLFTLLLLSFYGCSQKPDSSRIIFRLERELQEGNLKNVLSLCDSLKKCCPGETELLQKADSLAQISERIDLDFSLTEDQIIARLIKSNVSISAGDMALWEKMNWLEWKLIDGKKRFFNRAASNLVLVKDFNLNNAGRDSSIAGNKDIIFRKKHTGQIIKASSSNSLPVVPVEMKIDYTITVRPDMVPPGEIVRCWLPWPKENHQRQQNVSLISASHSGYIIAPDSGVHRTIYMEAKTKKGIPLVFRVSYRYQSFGQYFDRGNLNIRPYDKTSLLYKKYTSEQLPQICFTEKIKQLADSISGNETDPYEIVKKMFRWFSENIPWAGAQEYSIMPNIPEYVLLNRKGDCGMQTFLLMSMLRYKGIPVKWQSGWMMPPDAENLHDWCEIYYEGTGWVPADISYGLQYSANPKTRDFYISGIDSYRLIVNDGISGVLCPRKEFMRSDPYDFQRGEVEWKGGNLYYNKWNYEMKISYLTR